MRKARSRPGATTTGCFRKKSYNYLKNINEIVEKE